jgi:hypothetical protein
LSLHDVLYGVHVLDEGDGPHLCFAFTQSQIVSRAVQHSVSPAP